MKQIKLPMASMLVLVSALVLAAGTPVFAQHGSDDTTTTSSNISSTETGSSGGGSTSSGSGHTVTRTETEHGTEIEVEHTTEVESHHSSLAELKQKSQTEVASRKAEHKTQTDDQRKKVCEARKQGLTNRSGHIVTNSKRIQTRIDGILQKAIDYKTNKNLSPADWDSLVAAAQAAQSTSSASISTLESIQPTVDCNSTSVASDVATFKTAAAETRNNLKAYRDSVKAVLKSLAEVKQTTTTEGSN
jgi:phosphatidate phosphatase PAH1